MQPQLEQRQSEHDRATVEAVIRALKHPGGIASRLTDELRALLMEGVCRQRSDY